MHLGHENASETRFFFYLLSKMPSLAFPFQISMALYQVKHFVCHRGMDDTKCSGNCMCGVLSRLSQSVIGLPIFGDMPLKPPDDISPSTSAFSSKCSGDACRSERFTGGSTFMIVTWS